MAEQIYAEVSGSTSKVVTSLSTLETKLSALNEKFASAAGAAGTFASAIGSIKTSSQSANLSSLSKSISGIASASKRLKDQAPGLVASLQQVGTAVNSMPMMNTLNIDALKSFSDALKPLGSAIKRLAANAGLLQGALQQIATAMNNMPPLSPQATKSLTLLSQVAPLANAGAKGIKNMTTAVDKMNTSTKRASGGLAGMLSMAKRYVVTGIVIRLITGFANAVSNAMGNSAEWIESMNYFNVAYGQMAEKAGAYYTNISNALGIDMSLLIQNGAMFEAMTKSLGASADAAYLLSTNLMAIGIDLASLTGKGLQETWDALQSGVIAGQYKSLAKNYGINVTEAAIAQTALNYGLKESVQTMAPLDKAMLRYLTVLDAAKLAQGDMAKTLESPANMTRVFQSAVMALSRAVGNFMMPILIRVIPYVIAFTKVLANAFNMLAGLMGFEPVSFKNTEDVANFTDGFDDVAGAVDGASGSVKEFKKNIMGFDQFNILSDNKASSGAGVGGGTGMNPQLEALLKGYDLMLEKATGTKAEEAFNQISAAIDTMSKAMSDAFPSMSEFNTNILTPLKEWVIGTGFPAFKTFLGWLANYFVENPEMLASLATLVANLYILKGFGAIGVSISVGIFVAEALTGKSLVDSIATIINYAANPDNYPAVNVASFFNWVFDPRAVSETFGKDTFVGWAEGIKADIIEAFAGVNMGYGIDQFWNGVGLKMETGIALVAANVKLWWTRDVLNAIIEQFNTTIDNLGVFGIDASQFKIPPIDTSDLEESAKNAQTACELVDKALREVGSGGTHFEALPAETVKAYGGMPFEVAQKMEEYKAVVAQKSKDAGNVLSSTTNDYKGHTVAVYGGMPFEVAQKLNDYKNSVNTGALDAGNAMAYTANVYKGHTVGVYDALNTETASRMGGYRERAKTGATEAGNALSDGTKVGTDNSKEFVRNYVNKTSEWLAAMANNTIDSTQSQYSTFAGIPFAIQQKLGLVWGAWTKPAKISFPAFATGGFPEDGIFSANHNELVGKFSNGRTAVVNNIQIVKGVSVGVAEGVLRALQSVNSSSSSSSYETMYRAVRDAMKEVEFKTSEQYLDGDVVTEAVVRRLNQRTRATGISPLDA